MGSQTHLTGRPDRDDVCGDGRKFGTCSRCDRQRCVTPVGESGMATICRLCLDRDDVMFGDPVPP